MYFSSPLYRKNLHYKVVPKPDKTTDQIVAMKDYILEHHANDTGIIYCFSIKVKCPICNKDTIWLTFAQDTQTVAEKLREVSNGKIKTGVYNARIEDRAKQQLHIDWREGRIKVVCATIGQYIGRNRSPLPDLLRLQQPLDLE